MQRSLPQRCGSGSSAYRDTRSAYHGGAIVCITSKFHLGYMNDALKIKGGYGGNTNQLTTVEAEVLSTSRILC